MFTINAYDPTPDVNNSDGSRLFVIDNGNNATFIDVEIRGLTLTGGDPGGSGGAIGSHENLTIVDSVLTGNFSGGHGGAIYQVGGALNISETTISSNLSHLNGGADF